MLNLFNKPYREPEKQKEKLISILCFGLFIFLFLFLFSPFGLSQLDRLQRLFVSFGFGLVTSFMLIIFNFLINPVIINDNWTLGKNIILDITVASSIGAANYFYIILVFPQGFLVKYLFSFIWTAILVGVIPVTIGYILRFNRKYKTALIEAAIEPEVVLWESEAVIHAGNSKNEFRCKPKNIVYICSNDNYVTIVAINGEVQNKTTIRGTLKAVESELSKNSRFLRCHKCYIVNLDYVDRVYGNNQNLKIRLLSTGNEIPVSRSKADLINKKTVKS